MSKAALCVGINEFEHLPKSSWLQGCVNDARDLAGLLETGYGFPDSDISVLLDSQATKERVVAQLNSLLDRAASGELQHIVFTFSSHGTQIPDTSDDEADRLDEAFACYDINNSGDSWDPATVISDDELFSLFARLPDGVLMDVVLDTCHSGTGLKSLDLLPGRRPRFLPAPTARGVAATEFSEPRALRDLVKAGRGVKPVLLAACRADQTAADAYPGGPLQRRLHLQLHQGRQGRRHPGPGGHPEAGQQGPQGRRVRPGRPAGRHDGGAEGSLGKLTEAHSRRSSSGWKVAAGILIPASLLMISSFSCCHSASMTGLSAAKHSLPPSSKRSSPPPRTV